MADGSSTTNSADGEVEAQMPVAEILAPAGGSLSTALDAEAQKNRAQFLMVMYRAMWDNINRHILVVWQSITALFAALGAAFLSAHDLIDPDVGTALVVLIAGWSIAHAIDSKGWYNRNLLILTNIERQFLTEADESEIHYFFRREPRRRTIDHLLIQAMLALSVGVIVLGFHFATRVYPGLDPRKPIDAKLGVPYVVAIASAGFLLRLNNKVNRNQRKLAEKSPGKPGTK